MSLDTEGVTKADVIEKFFWQNGNGAKEDRILQERWGSEDGPFNEVEGRGIKKSIMSRSEQVGYLDCRDELVDEKAKILEDVAETDWRDDECIEKAVGLLRKTILLVNSRYDDDTDTEVETYGEGYLISNGSEKYILNELFVPILLKIQDNVPKESIPRLNEELAKFVEVNYDADSKLYLRNKYFSEVLKTVIETGGVEASGIVADFFEKNAIPFKAISDDEAEEKLVETLGKKYVEGIKNDPDRSFFRRTLESMKVQMGNDFEDYMLRENYGRLQVFHDDVCTQIAKHEWSDQEKKVWAKTLAMTMGRESKGSLNKYIEVFDKLGASESFPYLLQNLKSENELLRRMSAEVLYSLELKSLKISPEGVQYFNKVYKLVDEQDPDFWSNYYRELMNSADGEIKNGEFEIRNKIRLLDEEGRIGLFGEWGLLGFFRLKLEGGSEQINANVSYLVAKDFFLEKVDEKPEGRLLREAMLHTLLEDYAKVRDEVEERSGLKLHALKLHEQGWFIAFWTDKKTTPDEKERVIKMAKKYGTNGIKAFLTLDYGESASELLGFLETESLDEQEKKNILVNYNLLLDRSFEWRRTFEEIEKGLDFKFSAEAHEAMIRKSTEFLRQAVILRDDESRVGELRKLISGVQKIANALEVCTGLYGDSRRLILQEIKDNPSSRSWIFHDTLSRSRLVLSLRTNEVFDERRKKIVKERINIQFQPDLDADKSTREENQVRIAFDLDRVGDKEDKLSLDLGLGKLTKHWHPTMAVGELIPDIPDNEGGHVSASFSKETSKRFPEVTKRLWSYMDNRYPGSSIVEVNS